MYRKFANRLLALSLFALSAVAVVAVAQVPPGRNADLPKACLWVWTGETFGWGLDKDGCKGDCPQPAYKGTKVGQEAVTGCNGPACN